MSNHTYVCERCGDLRRRPRIYQGGDGAPTTLVPTCHGQPMRALTKGYAEAATKLDADERAQWLAAGGHIIRKPGRRWVAALSAREVELAHEQLARHLSADPPAI